MATKKNSEKSFSRSNTWNNRKRKLRVLGGASALSILITLNSCGPEDIDVKKAAIKFQANKEHVEKTKKELKELQKDKEEIEEKIQKKEQEIIDAEEEEQEAKEELQRESENL